MSLFDQLVDAALVNNQALAPLRIVVEKELLHHDILRDMRLMLLIGICEITPASLSAVSRLM